jgi:NADH-quinone oxidoreductase subunit C
MSDTLSVLKDRLEKVLGKKVSRLHEALGELTLVVRSEDYL